MWSRPAMAAPPVLWQFTASHYNEKARWALDWKGIEYVRRSLLPGPHLPVVLWMTRQTAVPVLVLDDRPIADSTRIIEALELRQPEPPLIPAGAEERRRALELEDFCDREIGPHVRRALFAEILDDADYTCALFSQDASEIARRAYRTLFPAVRVAMRSQMGIDAERAALSRERAARACDRLESELAASGTGYLVGDRFTVADLTAAALLSPIVQPPEFPYAWPPTLPEGARRLRASFADRGALRFAAEMYRKHRRPASPASAAA